MFKAYAVGDSDIEGMDIIRKVAFLWGSQVRGSYINLNYIFFYIFYILIFIMPYITMHET